MADVAILHAPDKAAAAARLGEAIGAAGYAVAAVEVERPERLVEALGSASADARILIWSRPLVAHALLTGEVAKIRQLRDVIEVSADGIEPPSSGGESRVVLISGWRGQPFHPGWQRIQVDLKRLCGARKGPAEAPRRAAPAASPAAAAGGPPRSRGGLIAGGAAAALLVAAAIAGASWFGRSAPAERSSPQATETAQNPQPLFRPEPSPAPAPAPVPAPEAAPVAATPAPPSPPAAPATPAATVGTGVSPPAASPAAKSRPSRPAVRLPKPGPKDSAKKYSPRNSRVMREFCARSGRSTPQCRTFLSAVRASGD